MNQEPASRPVNPVQRVRIWYALLLLVFGIFAIRLFYLQVIRYDYYKNAALSDQLHQYTIPAERGTISAHLGDATVPIVMNQKLYTLYADPTVVKDAETAAAKIQPIIGGNVDTITKQLKTADTRYVVLKKKLTPDQDKKLLAFKIPGIGTEEQNYRTYPQGTLAAQLLGFVNDDGLGKYGVEQALNSQLTGKAGQLKAVTDINGVPLAASPGNVLSQPVAGSNVGLTIDVGMQSGLEKILKTAQETYQSQGVSAVVMDVHSGAIKAMANYPNYDPANYQDVSDPALFQNNAVAYPIEPGSITKLFTTATSLQKEVITPQTSFYDPGKWKIDGATINDVAEDHSTGQESVLSTLVKSLNTGATWMLMQLGGGDINSKARSSLYDYFSNHFMLGKPTGIEQGYEADGLLTKPADTGSAINLTYAEMSFGQAYTATALQMVSGLTSLVNGGTYYKPYLVDTITSNGAVTTTKPTVVRQNVVSKQVSDEMIQLLEANNEAHINEGFKYLDFGSSYSAGGKTGTAEITDPSTGKYYTDKVNATFMGFIGGDTPQYAIIVYNIEPTKYSGFGGAGSAQPVFGDIAHMLINTSKVTPKS